MIVIIDYGIGNLRSVQKALESVGADAVVTDKIESIQTADKVVLPGVGAIKPAIDKLKALGMVPELNTFVKSGKPFLGICVGFQLLFEKSFEGGEIDGLGYISGKVERFTSLKVPQIGWNQINIVGSQSPLFKKIDNQSNVYFCHSYYAIPSDESVTTTKTEYGKTYTSSVQQDNIFGVQFHPEKSQTVGLQLLENFVKL